MRALKLHVYENDNPGRYRADIERFIVGKNPGRPDIGGALWSGALFYTEIKIFPDTLSIGKWVGKKKDRWLPGQVEWFLDCRRRGIPCLCAYSIDEVIRWFKNKDFYRVQAYHPKALKRLEG